MSELSIRACMHGEEPRSYSPGTQLTERQIFEQISSAFTATNFVRLDLYNRIDRYGVVLGPFVKDNPNRFSEYLVFARVNRRYFLRSKKMRSVTDWELRERDSTKERLARGKSIDSVVGFESSPDSMERYLNIYFGRKIKLYAVLRLIDPVTKMSALRFEYAYE